MSVPRDQFPPLPRVASPPGWSWHYFRLRYLPAVTSGLAVITAVWLWAANLPESTDLGAGSSASMPVGLISHAERQAGALSSTNVPDVEATPANGRLSGGGL
jgi:hypothetical protein